MLKHSRITSPYDVARMVEKDYYPEFFVLLADNLMLDELLCGECNSASFLKEQIKKTVDQLKINSLKSRIAEIEGK